MPCLFFWLFSYLSFTPFFGDNLLNDKIECGVIMVTTYRFELQLAEWIPGAISNLADNLAGFVGSLANQLPSEWEYLSAEMNGNLLIVRLNGPDGMQAGQVGASILPIVVGLILGIVFLIGCVIVVWHAIDEQTQEQENVLNACQWALENGYYTPEDYQKCVSATVPKGFFENLSMYIGAGLLLVGGGWLIIQYMKNKGDRNDKK